MNVSREAFEGAFTKNLITVGIGILITYVNGIFVLVFCRIPVFQTDSRYILYTHMVVNDTIMLIFTVSLHVLTYTVPLINVTFCCFLLLSATTTGSNSTLSLAGMALERYVAICKPLHHPQLCTVSRTYCLIGWMWFLSFVPSVTDIFILKANGPSNLFSSSVMCYSAQLYSTQPHLLKDTVVKSLYLSLVWMTLIYTYFNVIRAAKDAIADQASAKKAQNTILLHGGQLLLSMLSYLSPFLIYVFTAAFPNSKVNILYVIYIMSYVIPRLLSPLIYGVRDQKLFRYFRTYLTCGVLG